MTFCRNRHLKYADKFRADAEIPNRKYLILFFRALKSPGFFPLKMDSLLEVSNYSYHAISF